MHPYLEQDIPLVAVCNISETFYKFLSREANPDQRAQLIHGEQYRGDRALVWLGASKLSFISFPVDHGEWLCRQFGYGDTQWGTPRDPSAWLCRDIVEDPALLKMIVDHAGPNQTIQLIPYATTPEFYHLIEVLRTEYGLTVLTPETPDENALWLRDYLDTKSGFRTLASRWLPDADRLLPEGYICPTWEAAADVASWFCAQDRSCVLKADIGENGFGNIIQTEANLTCNQVVEIIRDNPLLHGDSITVEEYIPSARSLSPSLEMFVPSPEWGEPYVTYLSKQLMVGFGDFYGVLVSSELNAASWARPLCEAGRRIAHEMQQLGYVGHFDLDAIVDDSDMVYLVEINTRRTGGTHVHEFGWHVFGPDYLDRVSLLSNDAISSGRIARFDDLVTVTADLLYPINDQERGIVITGTSALSAGEFGAIVVGQSTADIQDLIEQLTGRIQQA